VVTQPACAGCPGGTVARVNRVRVASIVTVAAAVAATAPAAQAAKGFKYGVAAGEVKATSAKVWTRADGRAKVTVQLGRKASRLRNVARLTPTKGHDLTVQTVLRRLRPNTTYFYGFRQGRLRSTIGTFRTAPKPSQSRTVRFAWSGDADAQPQTKGGPPFWNNFQVYARMAKERNAFNINMGDTIYSDSEVGATNANGQFVSPAPALTIPQKWAKYKQNLALPALQLMRATGATYSHWDDHEFINDFTKAELGTQLYRAGVAAFRDYAPVTYSSRDGLYRSFRWGRNLEVFMLDERSFRSAKASANHQCDNPQTGQPDLAPTAPQGTRALVALLVPSLAQPVSQQCLDAINDPNRTMLGSRQYARFTKAIKASKATWKVIMNEVPIQQFYALPYDRWEGYAAERTKLLTYLTKNVKNTIFLTTDVHANFVNDARFQTLEQGGPKDSGIFDVTTGPVATKSFSREIDDTTGHAGDGDTVTKAFFKPPPPGGVGMRCAAPDVFSYGQVEVTAKRLTVTLKDANGKPVKDSGTGQDCAPLVLTKK
jgi:phosphodiesterase/alkaline phosphatase D-like protein